MTSLPKLIAVVGPTASGKTEAGIALARAFDGEVIAMDSRTIYKSMDVGTAKPEGKWLQTEASDSIKDLFKEKAFLVEGIPHWGIDLVEPDEEFSVADFQQYADAKIVDILGRDKLPILVGGTGLYARAVIDRPTFAEVPPNPDLRIELATRSNAQLMDEIAELDPDTAANIDEDNRRRLERAIEILRATGKPLAESRSFGQPIYDACQIGLEVEREELYARVEQRVDAMIAKGLVDEVRSLKAKYGTEAIAMTGIGYRQIVAFLEGKMPLKDAVLRIKYDTRHYAKRQLTWFKGDARVTWVKDVKEALHVAKTFLTK